MASLLYLTKRNIKLYLRDKAHVLFSISSAMIIIGLFVLFLGKLYLTNLEEAVGAYGSYDESMAQALIFSWILAGIIVLNSINVPTFVLSRAVFDKEQNIMSDFYVIPFKRSTLGASYILSSILVGTIITYISFIVGELYIFAISGDLFSLPTHLIVLGVTLLANACFSAFMYLIFLFIKSSGAIGGVTAIISSLGGFLAGVYITIGSLGKSARNIISANPLAHATAMLRNILMNDQIIEVFKNAPTQAIESFKESLGVDLYLGSTQLTISHYLLSLLTLALISIIISYFKLRYDRI